MIALFSALFLGTVVGSIYSLSAFGLVLTYRTSGIFNFAHGALGMIFAFLYFQLTQGGRVNLVFAVYDQSWHIPSALALVVVVGLLAPAFGWTLDRVLFRRLRGVGSVVTIVATIGALISLQGIAGVVWSASELTPRAVFSERVLAFGDFRPTVAEIATVALVLALAGALVTFLRKSRAGIQMRASVDRGELAELVGVDTARMSALSWAVGTGFAALAGILIAPFFGSLNAIDLSFLVVTATAAAVVGRLESLPLTLLGGLAIGMVQFFLKRYVPTEISRQLFPSIPFLVLFGALMLPGRWPIHVERLRSSARPERPQARTARDRGARAAGVALALVLPAFLLGREWQVDLATVPPVALIFLSLVLLSGHGGQVSLCQAAFAGFGAFVAAHLVAGAGVPFLLAVPIAGLTTVPLGAILAARAAALPPLFLGLATLAFGAVVDEVAFQSLSFSGGLSGIRFERPHFLASPRTFYIVGLVIFALFAVLVANVRRGRTGFALVAMRDSPVGLASVGTSIARVKFVSFCVSAFIAGVGGAMLAGANQIATPFNFFKVYSLLFLALAVIGGIRRASGALVGAAIAQLAAPLLSEPFIADNVISRSVFHGQLEALLPVFFGLGAIGLAQNPNGIVEQVRDGVARFTARGAARPATGTASPEVSSGA